MSFYLGELGFFTVKKCSFSQSDGSGDITEDIFNQWVMVYIFSAILVNWAISMTLCNSKCSK